MGGYFNYAGGVRPTQGWSASLGTLDHLVPLSSPPGSYILLACLHFASACLFAFCISVSTTTPSGSQIAVVLCSGIFWVTAH